MKNPISKGVLFFLVILFISGGSLLPAQDPFLVPRSNNSDPQPRPGERGSRQENQQPEDSLESVAQDKPRGILELVQSTTRELHRRITGLSRQVIDEGRLDAGVIAFFTALFFGIVHILGPGHGKIFTISYFLGHQARLGQGLAYSALVNIVDSVSAAGVVFFGTLVFQVVFSSFQSDASWWLQLISYSLILILTLGHWAGHAFHHHNHHDHGEHPRYPHPPDHQESARNQNKEKQKSPLALALSVALIPCPVSTAILVFGVANNMIPFSIFLVAGVSLGGFIAMAVLASIVIVGRRRIEDFLQHKSQSATKVLGILEGVSSLVIILFAGIMLLSLL